MRALPFATSLLVLACLSPCQHGALPTPSAAAAFAAFERDTGTAWLVRWHAATGTPSELYGTGLPLADWRENSLAEARRHADAALQRWSSLLGLGTSEFREQTAARMGRTWSITWSQWFRGLPVVGGRVDARIHMQGRLCYLGSTAWPIPADFAVVPALDESNATRLAWAALGAAPNQVPQPGTPRTIRLVVWGDAGAAQRAPFFLAWEVPISAVDAHGRGPIGRVYVDARTGAFLHFANDKHECGFAACGRPGHPAAASPANAPLPPATYTVMAWAHAGVSPVAAPTNVPLAGVEVVVPGLGTLVTDQNGEFTANLSSPTNVTVNLNGVHTRLVVGGNAVTQTAALQPGSNATIQLGSAGASEQQLAHTTTYLWTHRVNEFARSVLGNTPELASADNVQPTVNINSACNAYYVGNSINFYASGGGCNNTSSASVVAHEWGHGLDDQYGGISQANGLSEGWADICSMYLLDDPTIGHDFWSGGGGLRSGNNNRQYPSGSGPHDQGESWMGFAWKFRQNLRAALGPTQALAISNDVVLGSIVANAGNQQNAVLQVFLADDDDGNLVNGTPHHAALAAACNAHNLPYPPILEGTLSHTPLSTTRQQATPRLVDLSVVPSFGSFVRVRLHWNDGQARQRDMIPSGAANHWQALLPGVLAPQPVQYHFEATHANNATLRLPATGEYSYATLAETRVYFEDFEAGGAGWTHGAVTGADEWEIGTPAGRTGSGWSDPGTAAGGSRCAGTDLSGDGAYAPSSESWLRSPPIDCTGRTGVVLRFKRWLTAEPSFLDRLEIRIGGMPIWINPQTPLLDTGWTTVELPLAAATNNPAVVLEFRLRSNAAFEYGGWNLDDVELYTTSSAAPLTAELRLLPEQAQAGSPLTLSVRTTGSKPFLLVLGDQPGPTQVPGVPTLWVGGNYLTLPGYTDAQGSYALGISAPASVAATGLFWYSHALTLDAGNALVVSNPFVNLFTL